MMARRPPSSIILGSPKQPTAAPPNKRGRRNGLGWLALILFLAGSAGLTWYGRGQRCGWNRMSFPGDPTFARAPLLGQNCFLNGEPFFYENWPFIEQTAFFSGWTEAQLDGYCFRPYSAFLATLLTPVVGTVAAFALVDWLAWAACAWALWRLSKRIFRDDLAALLAVIFVLGGLGPVFHTGDTNIHLPSFACYYVGVYLLYDSGVLWARRSWRAHLTVGAFLALAWLIYTWYAILLIAVYLLSAVRYNRLAHLALALAVALTAPLAWRTTLWSMGIEATAFDVQLNLTAAWQYWWDFCRHPSQEAIQGYLAKLWEAGLFDSPVVVLLGVLSCLWLPRNKLLRWFGALVLGVPLLALCAVAPSCGNIPAYLTYGASIWIYCCLGRFFALGLRSRSGLRVVTGLALVVVVGSHFAWSTAHFWGRLGPVKLYIDGWNHSRLYFLHSRPVILSMTGSEQTPILFGGDASLADAGALTTQGARMTPGPDSPSWSRALAAQAPLVGYLALFGVLAVRSRLRRLLVGVGMVGLALAAPSVSWLTVRSLPCLVNTLGPMWTNPRPLPSPVHLDADATLMYRAELSPSFLTTLSQELRPEDRLCLFIGFPHVGGEVDDALVQVAVTAGPVAIPVQYADDEQPKSCLHFLPKPQAALAALKKAGSITVEVTNQMPVSIPLASWQRPDLPGRRLTITPQDEAPEGLPAIEIRLLRPDGSLKVAGF